MKQINNQEIKSVQGGILPIIGGVAAATTAVFGACAAFEIWKGKRSERKQTDLENRILEEELDSIRSGKQ